MPVCIVTDNTAIFPASSPARQKYLRVLPLRVEQSQVRHPRVEEYLKIFDELERASSDALTLTMSSSILPIYDIATSASNQPGGMSKMVALDSLQVAAGQGVLAQLGAQVAANGASLTEVEARIRAAIQHVYTLIAIESDGGDENSESREGISVFTLENGQMSPYKKVRTRRHLLETYEEFLEEFEHPNNVCFVHGRDSSLRARPLRLISTEMFPGAPFSELDLSAPLAALFGTATTSLTVIELPRYISAL